MASPAPANQVPYPSTGSNFFKDGGTDSVTKTSLSTMVIVKVGDNAVGAIQDLSITEQRDIKMIDELGTDGHIDSCPTKSSNISGSCKRIRFDRLRATEAMGRGFIHLKSQRVPFDIQIIDTMGGDVESGLAVVTIVQNVWIKQIAYTYSADNWIITDNVDWEAETIFTYVSGNSQQSAAQNGTRQLKNVAWDVYEIAADVGMRRGAMDSPDLINAPLSA